MRAFARRSEKCGRDQAANPLRRGPLPCGGNRKGQALVRSQRILGNQAVQRMARVEGRNRETLPGCTGNGAHFRGREEGCRAGSENRTGMSDELKAGLEGISGLDLSRVRVHRNSGEPAGFNALAFARGRSIHLAPNQERHLPHEGWHVVQQLQGRVKPGPASMNDMVIHDDPRLEAEADRLGDLAAEQGTGAPPPDRPLARGSLGDSSRQPLQREVRVNGGRQRVNEADYLPGGARSSVGSRHPVADLIGDNIRRVFDSEAELEAYANGQTDFIGDVHTSSAGTFWYRLPETQLTVLGESHHNPKGNVVDVVQGLDTSRFMYEPYHEFTDVAPLSGLLIGGGTQARMTGIESGLQVAPMVNLAQFDPHLENIVIKALTGATVARTEFIAAGPATMNAVDRQTWSGRATTGDYSIGERIALYLSLAIHIAADLSQYPFTQQSISHYLDSARRLAEFYLANQGVLDGFMSAKDNDDLVGIYELTAANKFLDLPILEEFTLKFHEYGSRYIEELGVQKGNPALQAEGRGLVSNLSARLTAFSPAREEIMWERILYASSHSYLLVGMGDAHRQNLQARLQGAGIANEEVAQGLKTQQADINKKWTP